jgi:8-oxo-dGTP pyrophosphatase MutT (NUDIX family)
MYKIYINDTPIFLTNSKAAKNLKRDSRNLVALHRHRKSLFQYVDSLEKNHQFDSITIHSHDLEGLKDDFFSIYKIIPAAGGVIFNDKGQVLMIFRRGSWDLPKGKIEEDESIEEAALREVAEEVGLRDVEILEALPTTFHTYKNKKGKRCLKPSYWFKMQSQSTDVILQTEEEIEGSLWIKPKKFLKSDMIAYGSINDVLKNLVDKTK